MLLIGVGQGTARADVTSVSGGAYGYSASISLFGSVPGTKGPTPTVTLPSGGSAAPITASAPSGLVRFGPATFFTSGPLNVSTQGTTGPGGSVTSSANVASLTGNQGEVFTATSVASTCTAAQTGASGSTTITNGTLQTSEGDPNVDGDETVVPVPANPAPNTTINGTVAGDSFRYVFNERIANPDGSITVNAAHLKLDGPTAIGDLIIGQSRCGVSPPAGPSLPALVRTSTSWMLRDSLTTGPPSNTFSYGTRPLVPLMGDWNGDGIETAATYEGGVFKLRNSNAGGAPDITFTFGDPRGFPVAGDFNGDGTDDVAVYRNGTWQVRLSTGTILTPFTFGTGFWPNTVPVAGDWNGDGTDGIGTYTYADGTWNLRNTASAGAPDIGPFIFRAGTGSYPVTGDWNADGIDTVAVKNGSTWSLRNSNDAGPADTTFDYGAANDLPLAWRTPASLAST